MKKRAVLNAKDMELIENRMAAQIAERHPIPAKLILAGIKRRGEDLARRLASKLENIYGRKPDVGALDINLYRDDWTRLAGDIPHIGVSDMPFSIDDKEAILVDDVLFSGRTARSAISALLDYGRPKRIELLTFIDRGHRELPICPDYTGRYIETGSDEQVNVFFRERDGEDLVTVVSPD